MPVILEPDAEDVWLDAEVTDQHVLMSMLHPYTIKPLDFYKADNHIFDSCVLESAK
jgi:putative SOS response-associated peptidase YedK